MEEVTLEQAKQIILSMGTTQSILMLASPGVGKSAIVNQIAEALGYKCRTLLGTQIAPEDISGIPRIEGEGENQRSVFYPPEILMPADRKPFVLFLDELPICNQEVQKAMYSLLLDRKIGNLELPAGTIVVAAGNNIEDNAMVRAMSTALVNRVIILHLKVSVKEWVAWGEQINSNTGKPNVRADVRMFVTANEDCLQYVDAVTHSKVPEQANMPFSTPRSWTALSQAMDNLEDFRKDPQACVKSIFGKKITISHAQNKGGLTDFDIRVLAQGTLSPKDVEAFCAYKKYRLDDLMPPVYYVENPEEIPGMSRNEKGDSARLAERTIIFQRIQEAFLMPESAAYKAIAELGSQIIDDFFASLPKEFMVIFTKNLLPVLKTLRAKRTLETIRLSL